MDRYAGLISDRHIFFRSAIPANNLSSAVEKYAQGVSPDDVLVLADDTSRWIGCSGVLLTDASLYGTWKSIPLAWIESVSCKKKALVVNDETFHGCTKPTEESVRLFTCMLQEIVALPSPGPGHE